MELLLESFAEKRHLSTQGSLSPPDYTQYEYRLSDRVMCAVLGTATDAVFAYLFYRSWIAFICLLPLYYVVYQLQKRGLAEKRIRMLRLQFRDAMQSISSGLQAGYSVENAFREAQGDMTAMHGSEGLITTELAWINEGVRNHRTLEQQLQNLAVRSGIRDIQDFADIFCMAKRSGGDLPEILRSCCEAISEKIEMQQDIDTAISAKQLEGRIMDVIPFLIIMYISVTSPGFFNCLYGNPLGIAVMTFCLVLYLVSFLLSEKIIRIEV